MTIPTFDLELLSSNSASLISSVVEFGIRGAVITTAAAVLTLVLRRASAAMRHLVWTLSLVSLLVLPALSIIVPSWHVPLIPRMDVATQQVQQPDENPGLFTSGLLEFSPSTAQGESNLQSVSPSRVEEFIPAKSASKAGLAELSDTTTAPVASPFWWTLAVIIWLLGTGAVLARLMIGSARVWLLTRQAEKITDFSWTSLSSTLALGLELTRPVDLVRSQTVRMPLACGIVNPVVLLPPDAEEWPPARRHVVLLHELAHVKRRDCLTQMLAHVVCALYWFNPLIWLAARQLRIERERACDDQVLDSGTKASEYADHLLELARTLGKAKCSAFAAVAIARRSQLEGRLLAILDPKVNRRRLGRLRSVLVGAAVVCVVIPLATIRPLALAKDPADQNSEQRAVQRRSSSTVFPQSVASEQIPAAALEPQKPNASSKGDREFEFEFEMPIEIPFQIPIDVEVPVKFPIEVHLGSHQSPEIPEAVAQSSAERTRAVEALKEALKDEDAQVREQAMSALVHARDKSVLGVFKAALQDPDPQIRARAAWALGTSGDETVVEPLIAALKDANGEVRSRAAWGLGLKGDQRAVEPLVAALKDAEPQVRSKAAWALGLKGDSRAIEALVAALSDSTAQVRSKAAWALALKGDRRAIEPLISALKDQSDQVRSQAAWALGLKGDGRAIEPLRAAMKDESRSVREQAVWALGMLLIKSSGRPDSERRTEDRELQADPQPQPTIERASRRSLMDQNWHG